MRYLVVVLVVIICICVTAAATIFFIAPLFAMLYAVFAGTL